MAVHGGALLILSQGLECLALRIHRICSDLRLQASGPKTGFHEIRLKKLVLGSSIMPGKTNPGALEALHQLVVCTLTLGTEARWSESMGQLELNVMLPAWSSDLIHIFNDWRQGLHFFREQVLNGLAPDEEARAKDLNFLNWIKSHNPKLSAWL